jgi:hypothetical protein
MKLQIKIIILGLIVPLSSFLLSNCHSTQKVSKDEASSIRVAGESFDKFYNKFHKDSLFQISRTKFPLGGFYFEGSTKTKWTRNNLPLMKVKIYDIDTTKYKVSFKKTATTFTQKVWIDDSGFSSECKFELIDHKWYLVYVADQNL